MTDLEIVSSYNSELRGICNYYNLASNFYRLSYLAYLMEYSCLRTLATNTEALYRKSSANFKMDRASGVSPMKQKKDGNGAILPTTPIARQ